jgi:hypothetical protein
MKQVIGGSLGAVYREKGLGKKYRLFHLCKIVFLLSLEFFIHKPRHGERRKKEERGREGGRERVGGKERERERESLTLTLPMILNVLRFIWDKIRKKVMWRLSRPRMESNTGHTDTAP